MCGESSRLAAERQESTIERNCPGKQRCTKNTFSENSSLRSLQKQRQKLRCCSQRMEKRTIDIFCR